MAQAQQRLREVASRRRAAESRERVAAEEAQRMERAQSQARVGPVRTKVGLHGRAVSGSCTRQCWSDACGCCGSLLHTTPQANIAASRAPISSIGPPRVLQQAAEQLACPPTHVSGKVLDGATVC